MKANNISELIGTTPLVKIHNMVGDDFANIWAKLEYFNPGGSVKDRIALSLIDDAEEKGLIQRGDTLIEPTSGNTGIGLAMVAASKGYKMVITMPESASLERQQIMKAYGAEVILVPPEEGQGMIGAIKVAEKMVNEFGYHMLQQFQNPANPNAHYETTGPEIVKEFPDGLDYFVSAVGTGGTITGTGRYLKKHIPGIEIIALEPAKSPVLSGGKPGKHKIAGMGAGFITEIMDTNVYDRLIQISDEDAFDTSVRLAKEEGIFAGISSGAAMYGALEVAKGNRGKNLVVIFPDTGERYLSTGLFK